MLEEKHYQGFPVNYMNAYIYRLVLSIFLHLFSFFLLSKYVSTCLFHSKYRKRKSTARILMGLRVYVREKKGERYFFSRLKTFVRFICK